MLKTLQSKWQSLTFKLLFYFLLSVLVLALIAAISFAKRIKPHVEHEILPNVEKYIEYVIADIGLPPNLNTAQRLADQLPFELRIAGKGVNWASRRSVRPISFYELEPAPAPYTNVSIGHHHRQEVLVVERGDYRYLFTLDNRYRRRSERRHWLLFLFSGGILIVLFLAIRRMLRPIETITQQVEKIGQGELDLTIEHKGKGELASLAQVVQHMATQIKSMLENKSALLLAISHEMRSPLTRMRVNLELLEPSKAQQQLIEDTRELESLVATILESERLNHRHAVLNRESQDLAQLIKAVIDKHPQKVRFELKLTRVIAEIDAMRVSLLLKNLIDNACLYSASNNAQVQVALTSDGQIATIRVTDHGIGIDPAEIPKLTEAFYRPDAARQRETGGYGLGLYLCKLIVEAHQGEMGIESELGKGTIVAVTLPLSPE